MLRWSRLGAFATLAWLVAQVPALAAEIGAQGELERYAETSPTEKVAFSDKALEEMRAAVKEVTRMFEAARRDGDGPQMQCLSKRLTSLKALLQVSESAYTGMREALSRNNDELSDHEFRKIAVAYQKSAQLLVEAQSCTDENPINSGDTTIRFDGPAEEGETAPQPGFNINIGFDTPEGSPFN